MTTAETLIQTRALIEDPLDWSSRGWGDEGGPRCLVHALMVASNTGLRTVTHLPEWSALNAAMPEPMYLGSYNDNHSHADVLALIDRAIEAAS
jgi:hypothetical protein